MFVEPELITGSNAYRSTNVTPPRRLEAKRDGYVERTSPRVTVCGVPSATTARPLPANTPSFCCTAFA